MRKRGLKRLVRPLLAGIGVAGGIAAANRALQNAPLPTNALGGTRREWTWRGHEIFATEAGTGPLVILVHGLYAGASSYEYRRLFPLLAAHAHVVAFDFLGCGLSDKPRLEYTADLFVDQIVDALDAFGDTPVALVGSTLGAAFAIRAATRVPQRIARLVTICPAGLSGSLDREDDARGGALTRLVRAPLVGEALYNTLTSRAATRRALESRAYGDPRRVTDEVLDHYYAVAHQPGARYVTAALLGGQLHCDVARDLPFLTMPLLVLWGEKASAIAPYASAEEFVRLAKDARLVALPTSALLPQEEEPEGVCEAIQDFLKPMRPRTD
jgi:pimeloyl-ACP methyl ester carboxylesterase